MSALGHVATFLRVGGMIAAKITARALMSHLHGAAFDADIETVRRLLDAGVLPDLGDKKGYTPLLWASLRAAVGDQVPVIQALIAAGADPDAITSAGIQVA
ncbi:hypothetical protein ACU4GH_11770 [Bradyrhizobium betae]